MTVGDEFKSPNAIPPRTSSTGLNRAIVGQAPARSVLRPLSEGSWLSSHRRVSSTGDIMKSIPEGDLKGDGSTWTREKERIVLGPYDYLYDRPGKDIRKQMILAFNFWLKVPDDRLAIISKVVGMLHTASLL
jgi:geranylgeranyl diphosphate synthase, type III